MSLPGGFNVSRAAKKVVDGADPHSQQSQAPPGTRHFMSILYYPGWAGEN